MCYGVANVGKKDCVNFCEDNRIIYILSQFCHI